MYESINLITLLLNMTMGTSIYTLPYSLYESGIYLGFIIIISNILLSFITSCFIIESISISNFLELIYIVRRNKKLFFNKNTNTSKLNDISYVDDNNNYSNTKFSEDNNELETIDSKEANFTNPIHNMNYYSQEEINSNNKIHVTNNINFTDDFKDNDESINLVESNNKYYKNNQLQSYANLHDNNNNNKNNTNINNQSVRKLSKDLEEAKCLIKNEQDYFMNNKIELCDLTLKAFDKGKVYVFISSIIILYLYIAISAQCLLFNSIIIETIYQLITQTILYKKDFDTIVYFLLTISFFTILVIFSQTSIQTLAKVSSYIAFLRLAILIAIVYTMIDNIVKYGPSSYEVIPKMNYNNTTLMFGNTLFFFMTQHSIPGLACGFKKQKYIFIVFFIGFLTSAIIQYLYGLLSVIAYSKYTSCTEHYPSAIQSYFNKNFINIKAISFLINFNAMFNTITGSILTITLKNNLITFISQYNPKSIFIKVFNNNNNNNSEKNTLNYKNNNNNIYSSTLYKLLYYFEDCNIRIPKLDYHIYFNKIICSFVFLTPSLLICLFLTEIQIIFKYFNSILGYILEIFVPLILVIRYRNLFNKYADKIFLSKIHSMMPSVYSILVLIIISFMLFILILYNLLFGHYIKKCVAEKQYY